MTRSIFIEQVRRLIYGGQPSDDAEITVGLVNTWLDSATAYAAQQNYLDNEKLEGISFVNNSFYTKFSGLSVAMDEQFLWKVELPSIPVGLGYTNGVSKLQFKDPNSNQISQTVVFLSQDQTTYGLNMTPIPDKLLAYSQGKFIYIVSTIILSAYTANVTMVSAGVSTDLDSELNIPANYHPMMIEYLKKQLMFERQVPVDVTEDGADIITTT